MEDESHFLLYCEGLKQERMELFQDLVDKTDLKLGGNEVQLLKSIFSKVCVKIMSKHVLNMTESRKSLLYEDIDDIEQGMEYPPRVNIYSHLDE